MWDEGTVGKRNASLDFDGTNDYVAITDNSIFDLNASEDFTWSFWIQPDGFIEWSSVWGQTTSTPLSFGLWMYAHSTSHGDWGPVTNGFSVGWHSSAANYVDTHTANNVFSTGQWSHVVVVYDASQSQSNRFTIYVDGINQTSQDVRSEGTIADVSIEDTQIGSNVEFANELFDGQIDEVKIFNYALTQEQINNDYASGATRFN